MSYSHSNCYRCGAHLDYASQKHPQCYDDSDDLITREERIMELACSAWSSAGEAGKWARRAQESISMLRDELKNKDSACAAAAALDSKSSEKCEKAIKAIKMLEWSGSRKGQGSNMGSNDGWSYPACPLCFGLKEGNNGFTEEVVGHRENCPVGRMTKDE